MNEEKNICENCKHFKPCKIKKRIIESQHKFIDEKGDIFNPRNVVKLYVGRAWNEFETIYICDKDLCERDDDCSCNEFEEEVSE